MDSFRQLGPDAYTCVAVPGYEIDPAVTAAIREFDPGLVPVWRIQLWTFPGSNKPVHIVHHALARYYPVPRWARRGFRVEMPFGNAAPAPNFLDTILEDQKTEQFKKGGPGGYLPWDWSLYRWCRWMYLRITAESWRRFFEKKRDAEDREYARMLEEIEYRKKQIEPYLLRKAAEVSDLGWRQYQAAMAENDRLRRAGLKPIPWREKKVMVAVRSPRNGGAAGRVAPARELGESDVCA